MIGHGAAGAGDGGSTVGPGTSGAAVEPRHDELRRESPDLLARRDVHTVFQPPGSRPRCRRA
ncbi:MAG: hypothetical protein H7269_13235 [Cellulomonas sp.]|nr:hypothetical protein [Cellulomonas sp.]